MAVERVLVIGQEESVCDVIRVVLTTRGFDVRVAQTAHLGLSFFSQERFGIVFLDCDMRDMDFHSLVPELKHREVHIAVILMGRLENSTFIQDALSLGVNDYLEKPFRPEEAYFKAKRMMEYRQYVINTSRALQGVDERNLALQKQNLILARRIEESTKNLTRLYEDLRETYMRTIKALAHAIDARDHYTYSHSDNVTRYAEMIAKQMRMEMADINDIKDACQLHDLGKIGINDSVLSKPGRLTDEEYDQIKLHSTKGAQILEPLTFLGIVIDIVKHHHERWDGKGYPDGLKGTGIPLGSRIMAVADSYDAMVSARPYRQVGLTQQEAVDEIKKNSGSQFDPEVVEAFLKVVGQF